MPRRRLVILVGLVVAVASLAWIFYAHPTEPIDSFERCAAAGNPILETYPPICHDHGRTFIGARASISPTPPPAVSQLFDLLVDGDSRGSYPNRQEVIESAAAWASYWNEVHAAITPKPPLLAVDFATATVIAVSSGRKPTGGYDVKVSGITTSASGSIIDIIQTVPGEGCVVTDAMTNPYVIIRTAKLPKPVSFRINSQKHLCK